jgi:cystathionine beta-lyase/cystathionine gamma-synthase
MKRATLTAHAGVHSQPDLGHARPHAPPIYQTTGFEYPDAATAEAAAGGRAYLYQRDGGPTDDALAAAIASLEGAEKAIMFGSGMGAIAAAIEAYVLDGSEGGHLVSVEGLYGGSHELIAGVLPRFGVTHTFVSEATARAIEPAITPRTKAVFVESISNPLLRVAELDAIGALCRQRGLPLLVDATFATPLLQRPLGLGATLAIHSGTKYLAGHGDAMCGVVSGSADAVAKVKRLRKFHGASIDPFGAWLVLRGLRTLTVRLERQVDNAVRVARALETIGGVERVFHPSLPSHPDHALASRVLEGGGAMVSFEVSGGLDGARRLYDRVKLIARAASLGDVTSLLTHPACFSHVHVPADARRRAGIADGLLRLSVGIEDADDLVDDLRQALG